MTQEEIAEAWRAYGTTGLSASHKRGLMRHDGVAVAATFAPGGLRVLPSRRGPGVLIPYGDVTGETLWRLHWMLRIHRAMTRAAMGLGPDPCELCAV